MGSDGSAVRIGPISAHFRHCRGRLGCTLFVCTLPGVRISYDPAKNQRNIRDRGLSFDSAAEFDFESALYAVDDRQDYGDMVRRKPPIDARDEVRELTVDDLRAFGPARTVLPESLKRKVGVRGRQKSPTKERITIRLSRTVVQRFRATGDGWQTRVDVALQDWLKRHNPAA